MPIYEYRCINCQARFEALRPMTQADAAPACPRCNTQHAQRVISTVAVISRSGGESRLITGSQGGGCGACRGGHCATCGH